MVNVIYDYETRNAVAMILERMNLNKLIDHALNDSNNIDVFINFIKYKSKKYQRLVDEVNFYL